MTTITQQIDQNLNFTVKSGDSSNIFEFTANKNAESQTHVLLESGSKLNYVFALFDGQEINKNLKFTLQEGSELNMMGLFLSDNEQQHVVNALINHIGPHSSSNIQVKGIVKDKAFNKFQGNIRMEKAAQQARGSLEQRVLLLSKNAVSEGQPELEIFANDVKADHAAAIGRINKDQLFYMTSRGIEPRKAKEMIVKGFLEDLISQIHNSEIKEKVEELFKIKLKTSIT